MTDSIIEEGPLGYLVPSPTGIPYWTRRTGNLDLDQPAPTPPGGCSTTSEASG